MVALTAAFDDVRTKLIGDAFDAVRGKLHGASYSRGVNEAIARRIIEIAQATLETDPERLADTVIVSLGIKL